MMDPPVLRSAERWQRVVDAWTDNTHDDAFTHTARVSEPGVAIEVAAVVLPSPTYAIREARARVLAGVVDPGVLTGIGKLAGTAMVAGLGRRIAEATGRGAGAGPARDAVIEIARLARQVAKMPRDRALAATGDPWGCWQLDTTGWSDLPDSCFAYTEAGRALLGTRRVATAMTADLYSPKPGQARVFVRKKVARIERVGGRLRLFHSMYDNVHGFELTYEVDSTTGRVVRADGMTPRLPYMGICTEPQRKLATLIGEVVDAELPKRIQTLIGGAGGCAQLYDLTADLLRLLTYEPAAR
ncbi:MAG: DUF2889 domain-containing protein [Candidatus Rokubacteria bacterium]|nr:DUF2889 domain-containing protein [Candidatus Rokubacteria bacterium]